MCKQQRTKIGRFRCKIRQIVSVTPTKLATWPVSGQTILPQLSSPIVVHMNMNVFEWYVSCNSSVFYVPPDAMGDMNIYMTNIPSAGGGLLHI